MSPRWTLTTGAVVTTTDAARLHPDGRSTTPCAVDEHAAEPASVLLNGHRTAIGAVQSVAASLDQLGLSAGGASKLLGVSTETLRRYRRDGAPAVVALLLAEWCDERKG
jgi:hypothetical protein